ncbi:MAG: hypothetical protein COA45_04920 [Zetaproteobacteria bacterium]|nr:MAG: hypothetical protein COA45_04920 [Zetaproteobacteria bacterium]
MTDESYLLDKKEKSWLSSILKVIFVVSAFVLIAMTVLSNMGGSNDSLKGSVEQFVSDVFGGRKVSVENLVYMGFFPRLGFDAEKVNVLSGAENGHIIVHVGKVRAFMTFWNVVTQTPKVTNLYIENFTAIKGVIGAKEFHIEKIFIDHDVESETAKLRGNGKIGLHSWSFMLDMDVSGTKGSYNYMFSRSTSLDLDIADIHFEGVFINHKSGYYKFENFKISSGDKIIQGSLTLSAPGKKLLKLKGRIETSGGHSVIVPDVVFDYAQSPVKISGNIFSDSLSYSDVIGRNSALSILTRLRDITGYGAISEDRASFVGRYNLDVNFDLKSVRIEDTLINNVTFPVIQTNIGLKLGPVKSDLDIMPSLMFVIQKSTGNIIAVLQDGAFNVPIFKELLKHVPDQLVDRLDIECGLASFAHDDETLLIQNLNINTAQGEIRVRDTKIGKDMNISDLEFYVADKKSKLKVVELEKDAYDFIQSSLQNSAVVSPCASYISKRIESDEVQE